MRNASTTPRRAVLNGRLLLPSLVVLIAVAAVAAEAQAQTTRPLDVGARVRVTSPALDMHDRALTVVAVGRDTLALRDDSAAKPVVIPVAAVTRLEVSDGRHSRGRKALRGAGVGLAAGLALTGIAFVHAQTHPCAPNTYECYQYLGVAVAGILVTPTLAAGGALLGVLLPPGERWRRVTPPAPTRVSVVPQLGGRPALTLAVSF